MNGRQVPERLARSVLAVPGSSTRFFEKAARSAADVVLFDLEDAVAAGRKDGARENVVAALADLDWGPRTLAVRVNAPDSQWMYRDVVELGERAPRLDLLVVPKTERAADVHAVDMLVSQIGRAVPRATPLGLEMLVESATGLSNVEAIAAEGRHLEGLVFGPGDYAAATGARVPGIGALTRNYAVPDDDGFGDPRLLPADLWHYPLSRLLVACRAAGVRATDGPYGDFRDRAGLGASARRAAALGFDGKWVIHPDQIEVVNGAFSPSDAEVEDARAVLAALADAETRGDGAVSLGGRMLDVASIRLAERVVFRAERIAERAANG